MPGKNAFYIKNHSLILIQLSAKYCQCCLDNQYYVMQVHSVAGQKNDSFFVVDLGSAAQPPLNIGY